MSLEGATRGGVCGITTETKRRPWLCRYLATFAAKHNPGAMSSALQISCNAPVSLHRDSHNDKNHCNYVCGFGDYKNGQFWIEDEDAIKEGADMVEQSYGKKGLTGKWWMYTGTSRLSYQEERTGRCLQMSLTGYAPATLERLGYKDRCFLHQCKFPLPDQEADGGGNATWLKLTLKEASLEDMATEADYAVLEAQQWALEEHLTLRKMIAELEAAEEAEFLQTKTIPTQEAMQELEKWREPLSDEVVSLVQEFQVVEPTTQEKLDELAEQPNAPAIEHVPSLVVFTRKQGTGRRRARICACGKHYFHNSGH